MVAFGMGTKNVHGQNFLQLIRNFGQHKITGNKKKDKSNYIRLKKLGWDYLVIWQCEISKKNMEKLSNKIISFLS